MKKFLIILLCVVVVLTGSVYAYVKTGHSLAYIENYYTNFTENVFNLKLKYQQSKMQKEEMQDNTEDEADESSVYDVEEQDIVEDVQEDTTNNITFSNVESLPKKITLISPPIAMNGAQNAKFEKYTNNVLCVGENSIILFSPDGEQKWAEQIQISNPVLKVSGAFILLFEQGGNKILVYNGKKQIYSTYTNEKILTANISSYGDCAVITEKKYYKGVVCVFNKNGQEVYSRSFGTDSPISAAISDSRRLAVSLLSTQNRVSSKVVFLDINKADEDVSLEYEGSVIFDLDFVQNTLFAYADNKLISINSSGKQIWEHGFNSKILSRYRKDKNNVRLLIFDNKNNAELSVVTSSGREKTAMRTDIIPNYCDICDGRIIYNSERNLYLTKLNGTPLAQYTSSRDIQKAYFINSDNILIVYTSSIEFLHIEKGE